MKGGLFKIGKGCGGDGGDGGAEGAEGAGGAGGAEGAEGAGGAGGAEGAEGAEGERVGAGFTINGKVVTLISLAPAPIRVQVTFNKGHKT
ncbi:hypothetical protein [Coleofasciculus sp.]|uniref:hypothetical protein n=1 Tax=Coleofasciculus sp. TaxID=3100458 RepID=UPI0039F9AC8E